MTGTQARPSSGDRITLRGFEELSTARLAVAAGARSVLPAERANDVELAVSELLTNAIEHGSGDDVTITFSPSAESFTVTVSSAVTPPVGPVGAREVAPPSNVPAGRGLRIVTALVDDIEIATDPAGAVRVTCRFDRTASN